MEVSQIKNELHSVKKQLKGASRDCSPEGIEDLSNDVAGLKSELEGLKNKHAADVGGLRELIVAPEDAAAELATIESNNLNLTNVAEALLNFSESPSLENTSVSSPGNKGD